MRWQPKPPSSDMPWWLWLFVPIWGPFTVILWAGLLTAFGAIWLKRWLIGPTEKWRPWFAWHPVTVKQWPDEERAWLEWVERRAGHVLGDAIHRSTALAREENDRG